MSGSSDLPLESISVPQIDYQRMSSKGKNMQNFMFQKKCFPVTDSPGHGQGPGQPYPAETMNRIACPAGLKRSFSGRNKQLQKCRVTNIIDGWLGNPGKIP
jgi:hypothetical protein